MKEELRKKIIEAIHGLPFNQIDESEGEGSFILIEGRSFRYCTIGRVMQALVNTSTDNRLRYCNFNKEGVDVSEGNVFWKLAKPNGQEATLEDQDPKTIKELLKLFK